MAAGRADAGHADLRLARTISRRCIALSRREKFLRRIKTILPVQPCRKKYFAFRRSQITGVFAAVPPHLRGVSRSSRTWMRDAVDADGALTNALEADGKDVWS
jgi:hypothetical protein